jgi:hypothetical protein
VVIGKKALVRFGIAGFWQHYQEKTFVLPSIDVED